MRTWPVALSASRAFRESGSMKEVSCAINRENVFVILERLSLRDRSGIQRKESRRLDISYATSFALDHGLRRGFASLGRE
jgi:hypothetical protein